jgi:hypothetical protein
MPAFFSMDHACVAVNLETIYFREYINMIRHDNEFVQFNRGADSRRVTCHSFFAIIPAGLNTVFPSIISERKCPRLCMQIVTKNHWGEV